MTEPGIEWAAGFFEGEGCARVNRNGKYKHLVFSIAQVHREPLDHFQSIMGGVGSVCGPYKYTERQQPHYIYTVYGKKAKAIADKILPYLFHKGKQIRTALEELDEYEQSKY